MGVPVDAVEGDLDGWALSAAKVAVLLIGPLVVWVSPIRHLRNLEDFEEAAELRRPSDFTSARSSKWK